MCVRVCMRACVRVCMCVCVCGVEVMHFAYASQGRLSSRAPQSALCEALTDDPSASE